MPVQNFLLPQKNTRKNLMRKQENCVRNMESKIRLFNGSFGVERFVTLFDHIIMDRRETKDFLKLLWATSFICISLDDILLSGYTYISKRRCMKYER